MQPRERLTIKEMQVALLVWQGLTNREIALAIGTTEQVVKNYLRNTFDKLGVWSRLELATYVARHGGERWLAELAMRAVPWPAFRRLDLEYLRIVDRYRPLFFPICVRNGDHRPPRS